MVQDVGTSNKQFSELLRSFSNVKSPMLDIVLINRSLLLWQCWLGYVHSYPTIGINRVGIKVSSHTAPEFHISLRWVLIFHILGFFFHLFNGKSQHPYICGISTVISHQTERVVSMFSSLFSKLSPEVGAFLMFSSSNLSPSSMFVLTNFLLNPVRVTDLLQWMYYFSITKNDFDLAVLFNLVSGRAK